MPEQEKHTQHSIIGMVIVSIALAMFVGLFGTIYLIVIKSDPALIAVVSGLTGTALGSITSVLNNTQTKPAVNSETITHEKTI